jgi:hypothetical protein
MNDIDFIKPAEWTATHKVAAQNIGMLYPYLGEARLAQWQATNSYAGIMLDVAIFMWLKNDTKEDRRTLAIADPAKAAQQAVKSLCDAGLGDIQSDGFRAAVADFMQTMTQVDDSTPKVKSSEPETDSDPM